MASNADEIFGRSLFKWRDDALFNQGVIAAELAIAALRELEAGEAWDGSDADHTLERLEAFLRAAHEEARAAVNLGSWRKRVAQTVLRFLSDKRVVSQFQFSPVANGPRLLYA